MKDITDYKLWIKDLKEKIRQLEAENRMLRKSEKRLIEELQDYRRNEV